MAKTPDKKRVLFGKNSSTDREKPANGKKRYIQTGIAHMKPESRQILIECLKRQNAIAASEAPLSGVGGTCGTATSNSRSARATRQANGLKKLRSMFACGSLGPQSGAGVWVMS